MHERGERSLDDGIRVVLELDSADSSPRGRLIDAAGAVRPFSGWLEMMDGLDRVRSGGRRTAGRGEGEPEGDRRA